MAESREDLLANELDDVLLDRLEVDEVVEVLELVDSVVQVLADLFTSLPRSCWQENKKSRGYAHSDGSVSIGYVVIVCL